MLQQDVTWISVDENPCYHLSYLRHNTLYVCCILTLTDQLEIIVSVLSRQIFIYKEFVFYFLDLVYVPVQPALLKNIM